MQPTTERRSPLLRFCDSFLQERNIKWVLSVGMLILLGSSVMMVQTHWSSFNLLVRQLIIVGYTGAVFAAGWWSYHRLALRKTGTMLFALTVLLLPVTFLAPAWVRESGGQEHHHMIETIVMLMATMAMATMASRSIFYHFLRGHQPTFVISYLVLAVAGALGPIRDSSWSMGVGVLLWGVFAIGSIKVSRHLFWLTERHDAPRIFGFFPILLLGTEFLGLFTLNLGPHIPIGWLGFGCLLVAIPVLLITDALMEIFQKRTGALQKTLPVVILMPFGVALLLVAVGLCLAAAGLVGANGQLAMVPTAALAAMMMALIARRTGRQSFVWSMLVLVTIAYQFSPIFFKEAAMQVVDHAREAVNESERLPYAFYGLTYLPLVAGFVSLAVVLRRRSEALFSRPFEFYSIALSLGLLGISWTYSTAMFPVGFVIATVLFIQMILFSRAWMLLPAAVATATAAVGFPRFALKVLGWESMAMSHLDCLAAVALLIVAAGWLFDDRIARLRIGLTSRQLESLRIDTKEAQQSPALLTPLRTIALAFTLVTAAVWTATFMMAIAIATWLSAFLLVGLLVMFSLVYQRTAISLMAICFAQLVGVGYALTFDGVAIRHIVTGVACQLLLQWAGSYLLNRSPHWRLSKSFAQANQLYATVGLFALLSMWYMPMTATRITSFGEGVIELPWLSLWPITILLIAWAFDATRRWSWSIFCAAGCLGLLALVGATTVEVFGLIAWQWLPAVWSCTAIASLPLADALQKRIDDSEQNVVLAEDADRDWAFYRPISVSIYTVFGLSGIGSLVVFSMPMLVAGMAASIGLLVIALRRNDRERCHAVMALVNWQLVLMWLVWVPSFQTIADFFMLNPSLGVVSTVWLLTAAVSLLLWQWATRESDSKTGEAQRGLLWGLAVICLVATTMLTPVDQATVRSLVMVTISLALLACSEFWAACLRQQTQRVWQAQAIVALGIGYLAWFDVIHCANGSAAYWIMGIAVAVWGCGRLASMHKNRQVLAQPLGHTAMVLPWVAFVVSVVRQIFALNDGDAVAVAYDQMPLLMAAAWYFWHGLEKRRKELLVVAAVIVNTGLMLLWQRIGWTDPQLYMIPIGASLIALVEIFKREITDDLRDPLRYAGALVILVSPTFDIVEGSWMHLISLLVASVIVMLLGIGLRVRALLYAAVAFLAADLLAMVVRGSMDIPNLLWIVGIGIGTLVVMLGAIAENHRERLLQRLRILSARMEQWD